MEMLTIELSESLRRYVEDRAAAAGYETPSDFVRKVLEREQQANARLEALLIEGLESGEPIAVDDAWWEARHAELRQRSDRSS